jgi:hypothetical protein
MTVARSSFLIDLLPYHFFTVKHFTQYAVTFCRASAVAYDPPIKRARYCILSVVALCLQQVATLFFSCDLLNLSRGSA